MDFQKMAANGHFEKPSATFEFQLKVYDILFQECFIFLTNLTNPKTGLPFLQKNKTISQDSSGTQLLFLFHATQACSQHVL